jgi:hypothetical protein
VPTRNGELSQKPGTTISGWVTSATRRVHSHSCSLFHGLPRPQDSRPGTASSAYFFFDVVRAVRRGTLAPFDRASLSAIAIACFRLFTFAPELLRSVPFFLRRIADSTDLLAALPYLAIVPSPPERPSRAGFHAEITTAPCSSCVVSIKGDDAPTSFARARHARAVRCVATLRWGR